MSFAQVLMLAQELETVGEQTYRHFAERSNDQQIRELFHYLADEEVNHRRFFSELHDRVIQSGDTGVGLTAANQEQLQAILATTPKPRLDDVLNATAKCATADELLRQAIEMEKAVIAFFHRTRSCLGDSLGEETVDAVIAEEIAHVRALEGRLSDESIQ